jgi:hypothetical protein
MLFQPTELEFLSAWAREEKAVDPYVLPAHQLQATHHVRGVTLIRAIKTWARSEGRKDEDVFQLYENPNPCWPWSSAEEFAERLEPVGEPGTFAIPLDGAQNP